MRIGSALAAAVAFLVVGASPALAQPPTAAAWWNAATVSGSALPLPTTKPGDLHVALAPNGPLAFAALRFSGIDETSDAVLALKVAANSTVGTPLLLACPTTKATWKAGDDQPWDTRPDYSCAGRGVPGLLSPDGSAMTFLLDARLQTAGLGYDIALVPDPASKVPFTIDFTKPDDSALSLSAPLGPFVPPSTQEPAPITTAPAPDELPAYLPPPSQPNAEPLPAPATDLVTPPALAGPASAPVRALPAARHDSPRARAIAAILLLDLCAYLAWAMRAKRREPKLIGGRAGRAQPANTPS